jgi:hypothetical protein
MNIYDRGSVPGCGGHPQRAAGAVVLELTGASGDSFLTPARRCINWRSGSASRYSQIKPGGRGEKPGKERGRGTTRPRNVPRPCPASAPSSPDSPTPTPRALVDPAAETETTRLQGEKQPGRFIQLWFIQLWLWPAQRAASAIESTARLIVANATLGRSS